MRAWSLLARFSGAAILVAAAVLAPAAARAATGAIDPACDIFTAGGILTVEDPAAQPRNLPPQVDQDTAACVLALAGQHYYVYFGDTFPRLTTLLASLVADGWTVQTISASGVQQPFDLVGLPAREADPELDFLAMRGSDFINVFRIIDDTSGPFGTSGLYVSASPFITDAPAPVPGGVTADDPSSISDLRTIANAAPTATQSGVLVATASGLTLLLGFPAFLLSSVLSSRYGKWFGWLERGRIGDLRKRLAAQENGRKRWLLVGGGMVLAALIAGFVDPRFGFNGMSLRLFLTLLVSFVVFNVGAWAVVNAVMRRIEPQARPSLTLHPATLVVVAVAVVLSRLLDFNPGIVFGLVAGLAFAMTLVLARRALVIIVGGGFAAAVALLAWIGYSLLNASGPPDGALLVGLSEFLGGVTLEGVSTLPIALIPLATLDGGTLFRWKKWVWGVSYLVGLVLFMLVLFTIPGGDQPLNGDFARWIVIFGLFAVVAVGAWLADWLVRTRRIGRAAPSEPPGAA
jgi:hypothetical protein